MDIPWDDVRLFLAVAEAGSLNKAAKVLRLGQPTVSRRLAALEYTLGAALFRRGVQGVALTTAGERLLPSARKMAEWAGEVGRAAEARDQSPRGLVRVTSAPWACVDFLAPFAGYVAKKHPGLRLEVLSAMAYLDLTRGEADLALRPKPPTQPELTVVKALTLQNHVLVSKALLAKLPKKPALTDLPWVAWAPPYDALPPNPQLEQLMPGYSPAFTSDNFLVMVAAAEAGLGAIVLNRARHRFARPSSLVPLPLPLGPFSHAPLYLVAAKSALDVPRIRRVAELLAEELDVLDEPPKR
jgi:DNA-binding transcriptional LysR family regulator